MLGAELSVRVQLAKERVKSEFNAGRTYARGYRLFKKLAPMEKHIDSGECPYCTPRFQKLKKDPDILALPDGSDKQAMEIIGRKPELRKMVIEIIDCPIYKGGKHGKT